MTNRLYKIALLFTVMLVGGFVFAQSGINKAAFFQAISSNELALMDAQLKALSSASGNDKEAFEGAMLMRKSATQSIPAKKLAMFKQGHKKLENSITKNPDNTEYRFLRLMIQENAPRALGYHKNISADSKLIKDNYKTLPATTQQGIVSYSKKSKALAGAF